MLPSAGHATPTFVTAIRQMPQLPPASQTHEDGGGGGGDAVPHAAPPLRLIVTVYEPSFELYPSTTRT
jgi:hypothetical protein